jgi:twitching motility protein PilT
LISSHREQQQQIRVQLSQTLKAVISQKLLKREDGSGRIGAFEIMFQTPAISNLIREGKTANIRQMIQTGKNEGMQTMELALERLFNKGLILKSELLSSDDGTA